ncbi:hypothetical protein Poly51_57510 [Rubripirellula tenax]|uniref:Peptidase MA-like domain-containing protein n=1 Tax=Rubripirellula tenax TaxID=2528015 RepID=A0A5C6ECZ3_9BACT|nr:peptidase MA family metallohydrolase [Rubripirellula tenax]TWU46355.1 hypothetical protein Poly51_57510 [Rubripirellula tenax]
MLRLLAVSILAFITSVGSTATAADLTVANDLFLAGKYDEAKKIAAEQVDGGIWNERWPRLLIECQLVMGEYVSAVDTYETAMKRYPTSLTLRMLGLDAYRFAGESDEVIEAKAQILRLLESSPSRYASRDNLVAAGRFFAMRGEDARKILEHFYDRVRDADPEFLEAYVATAELAIEKGDFKVAADTLLRAELIAPEDPRIAFLSSQAWRNSDSEKSSAYLEESLSQNPRYIPGLIERAELAIDAEQYEVAHGAISSVLLVNVHEPAAWSLLAVLAHMEGQYEIESLMRAAALSTWKDNPAVDHMIGRMLSKKYRFAEGAAYQRRAIEFASDFRPAVFQLAQDLLRLGHEDTGWILADEVAKEDPYNVVAHNLSTLNEQVRGYTQIVSNGIEIRMEPREAAIYGDSVMNLLREAKLVLCEKYNVQLEDNIVVEIFPDQKDFAIRTFGLPGGAGYLGVCFGRVITANSPASQGASPSNWQSVLWHEFCHVVTLEKTRNRMPRWLSEGISVYEERMRDPSWGESISPTYRTMMLGDELTPVSQLSSAFLNPPTPMHLQFAYYESSLVIEFLIATHGLEALRRTLDDLSSGLPINDALTRNVGSIEKLDATFAEYAKQVALDFGGDADWSREDQPEKSDAAAMAKWIESNPQNYWALIAKSQQQIAAEQFEDAKSTLETIRDLGAVTGGQGGPLELLASVYRKTGEVESEKATLKQITAKSSDSLDAIERLITIAREESDWSTVLAYGDRFLAVQPLIETGHLAIVDAAEQIEEPQRVVEALSALENLDPVDPAALDYRKAKALYKLHRNLEAKQSVLKALDEAPRYRDAHRLLLEIEAGKPK